MPTLDELSTLDVYRRCLRELHAIHAAWEPAVLRTAGLSTVIADAAARTKLPLLERDLRSIGAAPDRLRVSAPALGLAEALGAMYVLEGSTLGGQVIARHVAGPLGVTADSGLAFFTCYGARTGEMWKRFGDALESWAADDGDADAVVAGAIQCFTAFEQRFGPAASLALARAPVTA